MHFSYPPYAQWEKDVWARTYWQIERWSKVVVSSQQAEESGQLSQHVQVEEVVQRRRKHCQTLEQQPTSEQTGYPWCQRCVTLGDGQFIIPAVVLEGMYILAPTKVPQQSLLMQLVSL